MASEETHLDSLLGHMASILINTEPGRHDNFRLQPVFAADVRSVNKRFSFNTCYRIEETQMESSKWFDDSHKFTQRTTYLVVSCPIYPVNPNTVQYSPVISNCSHPYSQPHVFLVMVPATRGDPVAQLLDRRESLNQSLREQVTAALSMFPSVSPGLVGFTLR